MNNVPSSLAIITDAWAPQINGVANTLSHVTDRLRTFGVDVSVVHPGRSVFNTVPLPFYPEIPIVTNPQVVNGLLSDISPKAIHIATEGPLGLAARNYCTRNSLRFTTSFHTMFPEYLWARAKVPPFLTYTYLKWFHSKAKNTLVPTESVRACLSDKGFENLVVWGRGVDLRMFHPGKQKALPYPAPIFLYVGRVSVEKGVEDFCKLDLPGTKLIVGDGPQRAALESKYKDCVFVGAKTGEELAEIYASSNVFVFPSKTDTFGLVILEAIASGLPVAAFPVQGPVDILTPGLNGIMHTDLRTAILDAMHLSRTSCRWSAERFSWGEIARKFQESLHLAEGVDSN